MSVTKLRNSWWVDFRSNGVRYRKRSPENSRAGATAYELVLRQRLSHGEPIDGAKQDATPPLPTFKEFAEKWYNTYVVTNNKPSEQTSKYYVLKSNLIPFFATKRLNEITNLQIEEYKSTKLKTGLSPKTINNHLTVISKCLHTAQEWLDETLTIPKMKLLKVPPQPFDFLSQDESTKLLRIIDDKKYHAMMLLALQSGLRIGELLGLKWEDVNLNKKQLTVRHSIVRGILGSPKSNKERFIPLGDEMCEALNKLQRKSEFVFGVNTNTPIGYRSVRTALRHYCTKAGLRQIGWHSLRHTFASKLVTVNVSLKAVQELLGHSEIRTTMRYSHLTQSTLRTAIQTLSHNDKAYFGQQVDNTSQSQNLEEIEKPLLQGFSENILGAGNGSRTRDINQSKVP